MLPVDPMILYSYVNQKLRDDYDSLDALCSAPNGDRSDERRVGTEGGSRWAPEL